MRIDDPNLRGLPPTGAENAGRSERSSGAERAARAYRPAEAAAAAASGDSVSISSLAGRLQELALASPEREARLEQLGKDVAAGRYEVDSLELSRSLMQGAFDSSSK